jgi:hypothetical protein
VWGQIVNYLKFLSLNPYLYFPETHFTGIDLLKQHFFTLGSPYFEFEVSVYAPRGFQKEFNCLFTDFRLYGTNNAGVSTIEAFC